MICEQPVSNLNATNKNVNSFQSNSWVRHPSVFGKPFSFYENRFCQPQCHFINVYATQLHKLRLHATASDGAHGEDFNFKMDVRIIIYTYSISNSSLRYEFCTHDILIFKILFFSNHNVLHCVLFLDKLKNFLVTNVSKN